MRSPGLAPRGCPCCAPGRSGWNVTVPLPRSMILMDHWLAMDVLPGFEIVRVDCRKTSFGCRDGGAFKSLCLPLGYATNPVALVMPVQRRIDLLVRGRDLHQHH